MYIHREIHTEVYIPHISGICVIRFLSKQHTRLRWAEVPTTCCSDAYITNLHQVEDRCCNPDGYSMSCRKHVRYVLLMKTHRFLEVIICYLLDKQHHFHTINCRHPPPDAGVIMYASMQHAVDSPQTYIN